MALIASKLKKIFKGNDLNRLVLITDDGQDSGKETEGLFGFDDKERVNHGTHGEHSSDGRSKEGGMAHGKGRFEAMNEVVDALRKEAKNNKLVSNLKTFKDDVKEIVKEAVQKAKELKAKKEQLKRYTVHPLFMQKGHETENEIKIGSDAASAYARTSAQVRGQVSFIKKKLMRLVNDQSYARWVGGERRGKRIDRSSLYRIPTGERNLFKKKVESDIRDVVFSLVIDESGSMYGEKIAQARNTAVMFGEVLSSLKVPFEVVGYTTCGLNDRQRAEQGKFAHCSGSYNRADNLQHNMYKRFDENYDYVKTKLVSIEAGGCNYDQDHMEFIWERLKKREEKRKIIIWISDGQPCGGSEARYKLKYMVNTIGCTEGCEIVGIGIQSDYVADFYHKYVLIDDVRELGMNVVKLIEAAFIKRGGKSAQPLSEKDMVKLAEEDQGGW